MLACYRIRGGQVLGVSTSDTTWTADTYVSVVVNPPAPDGTPASTGRPPTDFIYSGGVMRLATPAEASGFAAQAATDDNLFARQRAKETLLTNPIDRKILRALLAEVIAEIATRTLRNGQTARTQAQIETAILNRIDAGTAD